MPLSLTRRIALGTASTTARKRCSLAAELRRKLRRSDEVPAKLVVHRQHDDKEPGHDDRGRVNQPVNIKAAKPATAAMQSTRLPPTTAARRRAIGAAASPERDRGIDDERDQEQVADLRHDRPRIGDTDRSGNDGTPPQLQMVQRGDLVKVDVHARHEIQPEREQADAGAPCRRARVFPRRNKNARTRRSTARQWRAAREPSVARQR